MTRTSTRGTSQRGGACRSLLPEAVPEAGGSRRSRLRRKPSGRVKIGCGAARSLEISADRPPGVVFDVSFRPKESRPGTPAGTAVCRDVAEMPVSDQPYPKPRAAGTTGASGGGDRVSDGVLKLGQDALSTSHYHDSGSSIVRLARVSTLHHLLGRHRPTPQLSQPLGVWDTVDPTLAFRPHRGKPRFRRAFRGGFLSAEMRHRTLHPVAGPRISPRSGPRRTQFSPFRKASAGAGCAGCRRPPEPPPEARTGTPPPFGRFPGWRFVS